MALFGKREKIFEVWGDAPRWKAAKRALKDAGIKIMESGFYDTEMPVCGCGAKLDHRDFGPNGKIDRHTYYLSVRPEDAERHPQRNVLLQCIGASQEVLPDFYRGTVFPGSLFLLCSDGFRHEISEQELYMQLQPSVLTTEEMMKERLVYLTELVKSRMEMDNISAVVMKTVQEG